jgi:hypothetical protein
VESRVLVLDRDMGEHEEIVGLRTLYPVTCVSFRWTELYPFYFRECLHAISFVLVHNNRTYFFQQTGFHFRGHRIILLKDRISMRSALRR